MKQKKQNKWAVSIIVIGGLWLLSILFSSIVGTMFGVGNVQGNVALIPIKGAIYSEEMSTFGERTTSSTNVVELIEKANKNPSIKAIIFEINSPGGTPVASDEIANAIKKTNKTTVSWIRDIGTSGAYWIASAADVIVANRMSITGSIGVIGSYLEYSGLLKHFNVTYQRLVSAKHKDMGSPFRSLTPEEEQLFKQTLSIIHNYFVEEVATNRKLSKDKVAKLADGRFFLGAQAKKLGLVDILGGKEDAINYIEQKLNITAEIIEYRGKKNLLDILSEILSKHAFLIGRGIGNAISQTGETEKIKLWT